MARSARTRVLAVALIGLLGLLGTAASAQTIEEFTWTHSGDESGWGTVGGGEMHIYGPAWDECTSAETWSYMTTTAEATGTVDAHIFFDNQDGGFGSWAAEDPVWLHNGTVTYLGPGDFYAPWEGDVSFEVAEGDSFGFGVQSIDCGWGPGFMIVSEFSFTVDVWFDLGEALAGTNGEPSLTGLGTLEAGTSWELSLVDALPVTPAWLVLGLTELGAPFKGGVLVPQPNFTIALATSPAGRIILGGNWPAGIPGGTTLYLQYWLSDPVGPAGWAASNALLALVP